MSDFIRLLCNLRWVSFACQSLALGLAVWVFKLAYPLPPLLLGLGLLLVMNLWLTVRRAAPTLTIEQQQLSAFVHLLFDIAQLTWMISWSGGAVNPFVSLLLVPIVLAAPALAPRWLALTAIAAVGGYAAAAVLGQSVGTAETAHLMHPRGAELIDLHLWGMAVNFVLSALLLTAGLVHLVRRLRQRDKELAGLREQAARDEGILGLATHAASMAHSLNTPLATLTLALDDLCEELTGPMQTDAKLARSMVDQCRDRVRELVHQADPQVQATVSLRAFVAELIDRWQLLRPEIALTLDIKLDHQIYLRADPALAHLLQAMLDNAADASLGNDSDRVKARMWIEAEQWWTEIKDQGGDTGLQTRTVVGQLFKSHKPGGMGLGLALSHATVNRYGGQLRLTPAKQGALTRFALPLAQLVVDPASTCVGAHS